MFQCIRKYAMSGLTYPLSLGFWIIYSFSAIVNNIVMNLDMLPRAQEEEFL